MKRTPKISQTDKSGKTESIDAEGTAKNAVSNSPYALLFLI
jgi:hypothetical protein